MKGMARRIHLAEHLSVDELGQRYRRAGDPVERSRWQMLWLLGQGQTAQQVALCSLLVVLYKRRQNNGRKQEGDSPSFRPSVAPSDYSRIGPGFDSGRSCSIESK